MNFVDRVLELHKEPRMQLLFAPLLVLACFGVYELVYATGGIKFVCSHSMYFPILLAGFFFGAIGGGLIGLLASILLGPLMPIDTVTLEPQQTLNWLYRSLYFIAAGVLVGYGTSQMRYRMDRIHYLAHYDSDTGLPNRASTIDYLAEITALPASQKQDAVLMKVSCDNLMDIEVALGFDASDSIINQMHERLAGLLPEELFLARTHRAEFAAVIRGQDADGVAQLAGSINAMFKQPFSYQQIPLHVESSVGYLFLRDRSENPDRLLQLAEVALINARRRASHIVIYDHAIHNVSRDNLTLLGELRSAVAGEQLQLHYQPKITLGDHALVGAEALMRWQHPRRGMIPPAGFIPQAEQSNLINDLTRWALYSAVAQQSQWQQLPGLEQLKVAVNISVRDLLVPGFHDMVLQALEQHDIDHHALELEVTESAVMEDIATSMAVLKGLSCANVVISIDDFGTGYSSLKYLHLLSATAIKIDQSFVLQLCRDRDSRHIVQAAIGLAHSMGMTVIAEGVETLESFVMLRDMGCDIAQGYFISRPLPCDHLAGFAMQQG